MIWNFRLGFYIFLRVDRVLHGNLSRYEVMENRIRNSP